MTAGNPPTSELSRIVDIGMIDARAMVITASPQECAALAARFALVAVASLNATVSLERNGAVVAATGRLTARITQPCAVSAEDIAVAIDEPIALRFVPAPAEAGPAGEVEVSAHDCDEIEYSGLRFDLGEAVAQSLGLAIDPFLTGPHANRARREGGLLAPGEAGPFGVLAGWKK